MRAVPLAERLARAALDIPPLRIDEPEDSGMRAVAEAAQLCWLDWATAVLCGLGDPAVRGVARVTGEAPELLGCLERQPKAVQISTCSRLAFLLGTAAHVQEIDDTLPDCMVHPGAPVISAAFAAGLAQNISGPQFLRGIAAGYEVISLVGRAMNRPPRMAIHARGFHATGVVGVLGAAVAASTVMGLDAEATTHALELATSMSGGLLEFLSGGGQSKALHAGKAGADGVMAASLAAAGLRGPARALEGRDGLFRAFAGESDQAGMDFALKPAAVLRTQRKYYACCHHCHPSVEALAALHRRYPFRQEDVAEVNVRLPSMAAYQIAVPAEAKQRPVDPLEARLSLPYSLAAWVVLGHLGPSAFEPTHLRDSNILALAARISGRPDPEMDVLFADGRMPAVVTLRLKDGNELVQPMVLGSTPGDLTAERSRLETKFRSFLSSHACAAALEKVWTTLEEAATQGPGQAIRVLFGRWEE